MKPRCLLPALLVFAALAFSSCKTGPSARLQEKSATYALFSDELKTRIHQGCVDLGDSADAAYIAFGKPSSIDTRPTEKGEVTVWTYTKFVVGREMSSRIEYSQPSQRYAGTPGFAVYMNSSEAASPAPVGGGPVQRGPQTFINAGGVATITLHMDILDNRIVGLRADG